MNQAAVPGTNQTTSIQRSSYYFAGVNTWFTTHSKPFQILSCPIIQKYTRSEKISLRSPATLDFPHPSSQNITSTGVLLFLESVHSDSIKRRARISRITSKMAYHNEWAAGPPPPLASQTPKSSLVGNRHRCCCFSFWLAATERSNPSLHQASRGLFENADCIAAPSAYAIRWEWEH